jgi:hypothetical protein
MRLAVTANSSILLRPKYCRAVSASTVIGGFGDDPQPLALARHVGREEAAAVGQGQVVEAPVVVA